MPALHQPGTVPPEPVVWVDDIAAIASVVAAGTRRQTVRRRILRGAWQQPCPNVVCRTTGALTSGQWMQAAIAHGGPGAMLSHRTAGALWGFTAWALPVHVVVPHGRRVPGGDQVTVHQSRRDCTPRLVEGMLVTPPARTAVDMALDLDSSTSVAALLGRAVQTGRLSLDQLAAEVDAAPRRGSRLPRAALADLAMGSRSAAEARLLHLLRRARIPLPEMNAPVTTRLGTRYVDALWRSLGKGVEVDGQAFHLDAAAWQADLVRQNAIQSEGIVLLRIAARRLWTEPDAVIAEIRAFLGR